MPKFTLSTASDENEKDWLNIADSVSISYHFNTTPLKNSKKRYARASFIKPQHNASLKTGQYRQNTPCRKAFNFERFSSYSISLFIKAWDFITPFK
jgi:hypothetical protein